MKEIFSRIRNFYINLQTDNYANYYKYYVSAAPSFLFIFANGSTDLKTYSDMKAKTSIIRGSFFVIATVILLTACKKKEDDTKDNLVGKWNSGTSTFNTKVGEKTLLQYFTDMGMTASDAQVYSGLITLSMQQAFAGSITFNSDNTYTSDLGGQADNGTWNVDGSGKQLTIDSATDNAITMDIVNLTSNELKVHWADTESEDLNNDNVPESISIDANLTFTR